MLPALESLDDEHVPATAGAQRAQIEWLVGAGLLGSRSDAQQLAGKGQAGLASRGREQRSRADHNGGCDGTRFFGLKRGG